MTFHAEALDITYAHPLTQMMGNMFPNTHAYLLNLSHNDHNHSLYWSLQSCGSRMICFNSHMFPGISHIHTPFPTIQTSEQILLTSQRNKINDQTFLFSGAAAVYT
jgi:hypothetical protein